MSTRQQSSVRLLSGGMSQEDQHPIHQEQHHHHQQQQQLLMQKMLPSSSKYSAPLYSLASTADCSRVRSTPSTKRMRNNDKSIVCNLCYEVFSSKPNLLIHSQQVHRTNPKPYQCPTCNKCFANSSYLSQHSRIHLGIKPYICPLCHRRFTQLCHLQQHIRTHTGEKPYKCQHPGCTKAFSQLSNLQSHLRSHATGGHMHGPRSSQTYSCHSCCRSSIEDTPADQVNHAEACRCCRMPYMTQRMADTQDLNSDLSYQIGLRPGNATIPKIRHRMSNSVIAHTGGDETPASERPVPTLSLSSLSDRVSIPVRSEKGEEGLMGTYGSDVREHDLSTRVKDTYLRQYDSQVRKYSSETNSCSILSNAIPWCCDASRASEKCGALNTLGAHSGAVVATAKKGGAYFTNEISARMKMCNTLFIEMNAGMRSCKNVSDKVDSMDDELEILPVESTARMKTCVAPLDEFGTRRKTFDLMAIEGSRGSKNRDPYQIEKKETFFSEVPRVNIDQPLSSPVEGPLNNPVFSSSYNPFSIENNHL